MSVVIAIAHYPHVNFYKHAIKQLRNMGIEIKLVVQPRGNLVSIVERELGAEFTSMGKYQQNILKKFFDMATCDIKMANYLLKNGGDVNTGVGSIVLTHASFLLRKPSIIFEDDIEYKLAYYPYKYFATYVVMPDCIPSRGKNILKYKGFKELAYLHPNRFSPRGDVLKEYGLQPNGYVFIREVSGTTKNYSGLKEGFLINICSDIIKLGYQIILSLENKNLYDLFQRYCTILKEPVSDIHSLMHYAAFTIASGDSMSRESCLLGTPAIYTGGRKMSINAELERRKCLFTCNSDKKQIMNIINYIRNHNIKKYTTQIINQAIFNEWEDTTDVIINCLLAALNKDDTLIEKYKMRN